MKSGSNFDYAVKLQQNVIQTAPMADFSFGFIEGSFLL